MFVLRQVFPLPLRLDDEPTTLRGHQSRTLGIQLGREFGLNTTDALRLIADDLLKGSGINRDARDTGLRSSRGIAPRMPGEPMVPGRTGSCSRNLDPFFLMDLDIPDR
jgi:hypothetical protein